MTRRSISAEAREPTWFQFTMPLYAIIWKANFTGTLRIISYPWNEVIPIENSSIQMAFQENAFILQFNPNGILLGLRYYPEKDNYFWSDDSVLDYKNYGEWVFELSNLLAVPFSKCELRPLLKKRVKISVILFFLISFFSLSEPMSL